MRGILAATLLATLVSTSAKAMGYDVDPVDACVQTRFKHGTPERTGGVCERTFRDTWVRWHGWSRAIPMAVAQRARATSSRDRGRAAGYEAILRSVAITDSSLRERLGYETDGGTRVYAAGPWRNVDGLGTCKAYPRTDDGKAVFRLSMRVALQGNGSYARRLSLSYPFDATPYKIELMFASGATFTFEERHAVGDGLQVTDRPGSGRGAATIMRVGDDLVGELMADSRFDLYADGSYVRTVFLNGSRDALERFEGCRQRSERYRIARGVSERPVRQTLATDPDETTNPTPNAQRAKFVGGWPEGMLCRAAVQGVFYSEAEPRHVGYDDRQGFHHIVSGGGHRYDCAIKDGLGVIRYKQGGNYKYTYISVSTEPKAFAISDHTTGRTSLFNGKSHAATFSLAGRM